MKHVQTVFQALVTDKLVGVLNEMSPPLCRYLVVALFVKGSYLEQHGFSLTAIASAFNAYLLEKGQAPQPTDRVRGYLDQLVLYAVVKIVKESQDVNKVGTMCFTRRNLNGVRAYAALVFTVCRSDTSCAWTCRAC
jgi:hypothetical protein